MAFGRVFSTYSQTRFQMFRYVVCLLLFAVARTFYVDDESQRCNANTLCDGVILCHSNVFFGQIETQKVEINGESFQISKRVKSWIKMKHWDNVRFQQTF